MGKRKRGETLKAVTEIVDNLPKNTLFTTAEICKKLSDYHPTTVNGAICYLFEKGYIGKLGYGVYKTPNKQPKDKITSPAELKEQEPKDKITSPAELKEQKSKERVTYTDIGESIVKYITELKQKNKDLLTDLQKSEETKHKLQEKLNTIKMENTPNRNSVSIKNLLS